MPGVVRACQARILSDLEIEAEEVPEVSVAGGFVTAIRELTQDVVEMTIEADRRLVHRPGQYFKFRFKGFPERSYSPTRPLERRSRAREIALQIRLLEGGRVSSEIGGKIGVGHPVVIGGPYGSAYLRDGRTERLILVASGTGFAPIWSIACAALRENSQREIVLIAGVRTADPIFMTAALERLIRFPQVNVIVTIGKRSSVSDLVREGYPADHVPALNENDIVYACGPSHLIEALSPIVANSKAQLYCDPFEPARDVGDIPLFESVKRFKRMLTEQPEFRLTVANPLVAFRTET